MCLEKFRLQSVTTGSQSFIFLLIFMCNVYSDNFVIATVNLEVTFSIDFCFEFPPQIKWTQNKMDFIF